MGSETARQAQSIDSPETPADVVKIVGEVLDGARETQEQRAKRIGEAFLDAIFGPFPTDAERNGLEPGLQDGTEHGTMGQTERTESDAEAELEAGKAALPWNQSQTAYRRMSETVQNFMERAAREGKETFRIGETTYAAKRVPPEQWRQNAGTAVAALEEFGIPAFVYEGTLESNTDGVTTTSFGQSGTLRDGTVAVHNWAEVPARILAGHEMYHAAERKNVPERIVFLNTLKENLNFSSPRLLGYLNFVAKCYFGESFDLSVFMDNDNPDALWNSRLGREFFAAISGDFNEPLQITSDLFIDEASVRSSWKKMADAMHSRSEKGES